MPKKQQIEVKVGHVFQERDRRMGGRKVEVIGLTIAKAQSRYGGSAAMYAVVRRIGSQLKPSRLRLDKLERQNGWDFIGSAP